MIVAAVTLPDRTAREETRTVIGGGAVGFDKPSEGDRGGVG